MLCAESLGHHRGRPSHPCRAGQPRRRAILETRTRRRFLQRSQARGHAAHHSALEIRARAGPPLYGRSCAASHRQPPLRRFRNEQHSRRRHVLTPVSKYSRAPGPRLFYLQRSQSLSRHRRSLRLRRHVARYHRKSSRIRPSGISPHARRADRRRRAPPRQRPSEGRHFARPGRLRRPHEQPRPLPYVFRPSSHGPRADHHARSRNRLASPANRPRILRTLPNSRQRSRQPKRLQTNPRPTKFLELPNGFPGAHPRNARVGLLKLVFALFPLFLRGSLAKFSLYLVSALCHHPHGDFASRSASQFSLPASRATPRCSKRSTQLSSSTLDSGARKFSAALKPSVARAPIVSTLSLLLTSTRTIPPP